MRRHLGKILLLIFVLLVVVQLIPVERSNPPVTAEILAPAEVMPLLRRACYDCHSHETVWPWYSRYAPLSWLVAHDVSEAREHLNFSLWGELPAHKQAKLMKEIGEEVSEGGMPPFIYLPAHPEARLTDGEKTLLLDWAGYLGERHRD